MNYYVLPEQMPAGCSSCELLSGCLDCEGLPAYCSIDKDDKGFPIHKFRDYGNYDPVPDARPDWCRLRPVGVMSGTTVAVNEYPLFRDVTNVSLKIHLKISPGIERLSDAQISEYLKDLAQSSLDRTDWADPIPEVRRSLEWQAAKIKARLFTGGPER